MTDSPQAAQGALSEEELRGIDAYWRAANYLTVGQIYLLDNPLLREPLKLDLHPAMSSRLLAHHDYVRAHGQDMPEIRDWQWNG